MAQKIKSLKDLKSLCLKHNLISPKPKSLAELKELCVKHNIELPKYGSGKIKRY